MASASEDGSVAIHRFGDELLNYKYDDQWVNAEK